MWVIDIHDRTLGILRNKEPGLSLEIALHITVIVQVILSQVCKSNNCEVRAKYTTHIERVTTNLHHEIPNMSLAHRGYNRL